MAVDPPTTPSDKEPGGDEGCGMLGLTFLAFLIIAYVISQLIRFFAWALAQV